MSSVDSRIRNKKKSSLFVKLAYCFTIVAFISFMITKMEHEAPNIETVSNSFVGKSYIFPICITDNDSGISKIIVTLSKDDYKIKLFEKEFDSKKIRYHSNEKCYKFQIKISPDDLNLSDGIAKIQIVAYDSSLRNFGKGNKAVFETELQIDTTFPQIDILRYTKNIYQGGSGIVVYKLSEPCIKSGVMVENNFFQGYSGYFKDKSTYLAFFALKHNQDTNTKIFLSATDQSGNKSQAGFKYTICNKKFAEDEILITNQFLNWKLPEFSNFFHFEKNIIPIDLFLKINKEMRALNNKKVREICSKTEQKIMWKGSFLRMPRSENKAGFADNRNYIYNETIVDQQIHLGIDIASIAKSSVPSANAGKIIFSGNLGIYGNTVIIDHGFGLFSLYSHLSESYVRKDELVDKGFIIGRTGETGLAGGDHLHFSMMINNTYVNPIEWWDKSWIENNITAQLNSIETN